MKLTIQSIRNLYGPKLYILQETNTTPESPVSKFDPMLFMKGEAVEWKMKEGAQLVLVLLQKEFSNKGLIELLKSMVVKAQIPFDQVGFGVIPDHAKEISLEDLPTDIGILVGTPGDHLPESMRLGEHDIFLVPSLQQLTEDPDQINMTIQTLQRAKFLIK